MNPVECAILVFFRRYRIMPAEMLFFNPTDCKLATRPFNAAMQSLMRQGLVVKERPNLAYSLTPAGYDASISAEQGAELTGRTRV